MPLPDPKTQKMRPGNPLIQEALDSLEQLGLIAKTGEIRNGQPVYASTKFGQMLPDGEANMAKLDDELKRPN